MTVRCEGSSWMMEQLGEKQDFESELTRLGFKHEDFALHVRRAGLGGINRSWMSHYAVRVINTFTGRSSIYWGGPGEDWVAEFASDAARGVYSTPAGPPGPELRASRAIRKRLGDGPA